MNDPAGGGRIHIGGFGPAPARPQEPPSDMLAGFAARAATDGRMASLPLVTITVADTTGARWEMEILGYPDLIRAIACLPGVGERQA